MSKKFSMPDLEPRGAGGEVLKAYFQLLVRSHHKMQPRVYVQLYIMSYNSSHYVWEAYSQLFFRLFWDENQFSYNKGYLLIDGVENRCTLMDLLEQRSCYVVLGQHHFSVRKKNVVFLYFSSNNRTSADVQCSQSPHKTTLHKNIGNNCLGKKLNFWKS